MNLDGLETVQLLHENGANFDRMIVVNTPTVQLEHETLVVSEYKENIESFVKRINELPDNEFMFIYEYNNSIFRSVISKVTITV